MVAFRDSIGGFFLGGMKLDLTRLLSTPATWRRARAYLARERSSGGWVSPWSLAGAFTTAGTP